MIVTQVFSALGERSVLLCCKFVWGLEAARGAVAASPSYQVLHPSLWINYKVAWSCTRQRDAACADAMWRGKAGLLKLDTFLLRPTIPKNKPCSRPAASLLHTRLALGKHSSRRSYQRCWVAFYTPGLPHVQKAADVTRPPPNLLSWC